MAHSHSRVLELSLRYGAFFTSLALTACSAGDDNLGYKVAVYINGKPSAFEGRSIRVGYKVASSPGLSPEAGPGMLGVYVEVCTRDRTKFLTGPIRIEVTGPEGSLSDVSLQRLACRDSREGGNMEDNHLLLQENGLLDTEFGRGKQVWATCYHGRLVPCPADTF